MVSYLTTARSHRKFKLKSKFLFEPYFCQSKIQCSAGWVDPTIYISVEAPAWIKNHRIYVKAYNRAAENLKTIPNLKAMNSISYPALIF